MPEPRRDDPYALLGLSPGASLREITAAYRRRVRQLHPDAAGAAGGDPEQLAAVVAAYHLLRDPRRRADHDQRTRGPRRRAETGTAIPIRRHHAEAPPPPSEPDLRVGPVHYHPR